ncbi:uncharacterized protein LOC113467660 [Diaphorina citri]|uniref:Uncharacterized protein LOC113467660 n=1 Tax=Diaphorina citri TaxID=121845 RepID=A0A3Q0IYM0_DIACI|nr:uncharacterized protein LOC113467660 [Diaphorina citri]XP_026679773.1 uncharacterized protein LOC113467660 [Diaphorina citri]
MKLITALVMFISVTNIDMEPNNEYNFLLSNKPIHEFINMFQKFHQKSANLRRMKRAFDKSQNSMETHEKENIINALPDKTRETLEDDKLRLELGQKYNAEFRNLLKMDGLELEESVVNQLNQSLVDMFTETMKETMNRYNIDITDKNFKLPRRAFRDVRIFFSKRLEKWYNQHVIRLLLHKRSHDLRHKMGVYPDWPYNVTLNVLTNYFEAQKAYDDKFLYINTYYRRVINSLTSKVEMHLFPHFINYVEDAIVQKYKT